MGNDQQILVVVEAFKKARNEFESLINELENAEQKITSVNDNLIAAWEGEAGSEFLKQTDIVEEIFSKDIESLKEILQAKLDYALVSHSIDTMRVSKNAATLPVKVLRGQREGAVVEMEHYGTSFATINTIRKFPITNINSAQVISGFSRVGKDIYDVENEYYSGKTIYNDVDPIVKDLLKISPIVNNSSISVWLKQ